MPSAKVQPPSVPAEFAAVPRSVLRRLDLDEVVLSSLSVSQPNVEIGVLIALGSIDRYLRTAHRQQRRVQTAFRTISQRRTMRGNALFDEVHFYLICWTRIAKLMQFVSQSTRYRYVGLVLRRYSTDLKERIDARDHLEHFEERLPGGKNQSKLPVPGDLLNMIGHHVTYGGNKVDIGTKSLELLVSLVSEFRTALLYDSLIALMTRDKDRTLDLLRRSETRAYLSRQQKKLMRLIKSEQGLPNQAL